MTIWHASVIRILRESGLFPEIQLLGGKVRAFGWDDFPHPDHAALTILKSYPHHFQERTSGGSWQFSESAFRGDVEKEIHEVINLIRQRDLSESK